MDAGSNPVLTPGTKSGSTPVSVTLKGRSSVTGSTRTKFEELYSG